MYLEEHYGTNSGYVALRRLSCTTKREKLRVTSRAALSYYFLISLQIVDGTKETGAPSSVLRTAQHCSDEQRGRDEDRVLSPRFRIGIKLPVVPTVPFFLLK
jgi:hypothetical protein